MSERSFSCHRSRPISRCGGDSRGYGSQLPRRCSQGVARHISCTLTFAVIMSSERELKRKKINITVVVKTFTNKRHTFHATPKVHYLPHRSGDLVHLFVDGDIGLVVEPKRHHGEHRSEIGLSTRRQRFPEVLQRADQERPLLSQQPQSPDTRAKYVCVIIKLHITARSGPVILVILCHSH